MTQPVRLLRQPWTAPLQRAASMSLISLIIMLAVLGLIWYLVVTYIPMPAPMKTVITVIAVIALCLLLLNLAGIGDFRIGRPLN
jgi:hypothetical protein